MRQQYESLLDALRPLGRIAVAFSGGVDSTLLARASRDALGRENVLALTASSILLSAEEVAHAGEMARAIDVEHRVLACSPLEIPGLIENPPERCYLCKRVVFGTIIEAARSDGFETLIDGSTAEDFAFDYRPGIRAARELGVVSPLVSLGWGKNEIRSLAQALGLPNWNQPSAACLASRLPYGTEITPERLRQIDRSEAALRAEGFPKARVRYHGDVARIEVPPADISRFADSALRERMVSALRDAGFRYVALDLTGYRTGSLNEALHLSESKD